MKKKNITISVLLGLIFLLGSCAKPGEMVILLEVTGPMDTNCYLLYDARTGEAALIDVGGPIDTLLAHIEENALHVKYIFATHVHMDHVEGVPRIKERFPDALVGCNERGIDDFLLMPE